MYCKSTCRKNVYDRQTILLGDVQSLLQSNFNASWPVKFYCGGWPGGDGAAFRIRILYLSNDSHHSLITNWWKFIFIILTRVYAHHIYDGRILDRLFGARWLQFYPGGLAICGTGRGPRHLRYSTRWSTRRVIYSLMMMMHFIINHITFILIV